MTSYYIESFHTTGSPPKGWLFIRSMDNSKSVYTYFKVDSVQLQILWAMHYENYKKLSHVYYSESSTNKIAYGCLNHLSP